MARRLYMVHVNSIWLVVDSIPIMVGYIIGQKNLVMGQIMCALGIRRCNKDVRWVKM